LKKIRNEDNIRDTTTSNTEKLFEKERKGHENSSNELLKRSICAQLKKSQAKFNQQQINLLNEQVSETYNILEEYFNS
jgi:hypothetical protein